MEDDSYDECADNLTIENMIKFAVYTPAPSFLGAYHGYAETIN